MGIKKKVIPSSITVFGPIKEKLGVIHSIEDKYVVCAVVNHILTKNFEKDLEEALDLIVDQNHKEDILERLGYKPPVSTKSESTSPSEQTKDAGARWWKMPILARFISRAP